MKSEKYLRKLEKISIKLSKIMDSDVGLRKKASKMIKLFEKSLYNSFDSYHVDVIMGFANEYKNHIGRLEECRGATYNIYVNSQYKELYKVSWC